MIQIQFSVKKKAIQTVKVQGHANSGPYGQDLVCSAVSAIALSSLNAIDVLYPNTCRLEAKDNVVWIEVLHDSSELQVCLHFMQEQLRALALEYPKFIRMHIGDLK